MTMSDYRGKAVDLDGLRDLDRTIGYLAATKDLSQAARMADTRRASPKVVETLLKAAQAAGTADTIGVDINAGQWGQFYSQMRSIGCADAMQPFTVAMPNFLGRFVLMASVAAATVSEGAGKPVRRLSYSTNEADPAKGVAMVALTREVAMEAEIQRTVRQELQRSIAQWTDGLLLTACAANSADSTTVSGSFQDWVDDLHELLQIVKGSSSSNLFLVVSPDLAKAICAQGLTAGLNLDWRGFDIAGVRVMPSDAQGSASMTLIDARQVAMRLGQVSLRSSDEGSVEMDTAPSGTSSTSVQSSTLVSLFQTNTVAIMAERSATIEAITTHACATMTNVTLGVTDGSPN
jgi:hypothetical protein